VRGLWLHSARLKLFVLCIVSVAVLVGASSASAIVPPRNCGKLSVNGRTYNIKADQLRCTRARRYAKRYLVNRWRPSGYSCRTYQNSALRFRCARGIRVYYAIRR
jgi:hypothetical protein